MTLSLTARDKILDPFPAGGAAHICIYVYIARVPPSSLPTKLHQLHEAWGGRRAASEAAAAAAAAAGLVDGRSPSGKTSWASSWEHLWIFAWAQHPVGGHCVRVYVCMFVYVRINILRSVFVKSCKSEILS